MHRRPSLLFHGRVLQNCTHVLQSICSRCSMCVKLLWPVLCGQSNVQAVWPVSAVPTHLGLKTCLQHTATVQGFFSTNHLRPRKAATTARKCSLTTRRWSMFCELWWGVCNWSGVAPAIGRLKWSWVSSREVSTSPQRNAPYLALFSPTRIEK